MLGGNGKWGGSSIRTLLLLPVLVFSLAPAPGAVAAAAPGGALEARVWLDRGPDPVLHRGDGVRLYYRTSEDAFVAIFQIDTNGGTRLLFPRSPEESHSIRAGRDYRLLFPRSPYWEVEDDPGTGFFFIVASAEPLDYAFFGYSHFDRGWDISRIGRQVYSDPYVAIGSYAAALVAGQAYAMDFAAYHVGKAYDHPRFLCYSCHGFMPFSSWDPYQYACSQFRVVVFDDPFYYPASRYRGDRLVFPNPPRPMEPRFAFKRREPDEPPGPLTLGPGSRGLAGPWGVTAPPHALPGPAPRGTPPGNAPQAPAPADGRSRPVLQPRPSEPPPPASTPPVPQGGARPAPPPPGGPNPTP